MINPSSLMKMMDAKNKFEANHPKFFQFLNYVFATGVKEGTVIEIKVTKPGEDPVVTNLEIQNSDIELFNSLKDIAN